MVLTIEINYVTSTILTFTNALTAWVSCGFACSQTVWTDLFLLVKTPIKGDRRRRLKNLGARLEVSKLYTTMSFGLQNAEKMVQAPADVLCRPSRGAIWQPSDTRPG